MKLSKKLLMAGVVVALTGAAQFAHASVILNFGQVGTGSPIVATNPTASTTNISAVNTAIAITSIMGGSPTTAYFNLSANSSAAAYTAGGQFFQTFNGTFSITSSLNGGGTNYLSGTFQDLTSAYGSSAGLRSSTPGQLVSFTSTVIPATDLADPKALSFSFSDVTPSVTGLCGPVGSPTLCPFASSVAGTFSATAAAVPEPASMALLGAGLVGIGLARSRRKRKH